MPKLKVPSIKLVLRKEKPLKDGLMPVFIRVAFNGMVEKSTGINTDEAHWDKSERRIRRGFPNYKSLNEQLSVIYQECVDRMMMQKLNKKPYDIKFILNGDGIKPEERNTFTRLINDYLRNNSLKVTTQWHYRYVKNKLIDCFGDDVSKWNIKEFEIYLSGLNITDSTRRLILNKIDSLGLSIEGFNLKKYKIARRNGYIPLSAMPFVKQVALSYVGVINGDSFSYHQEFIDNVNNWRWHGWVGIWVYIDYLFQGLAPIDLNQITKEEIEIKKINGNSYYCWDGKRSKTNVDVKIRVKRNIFTNMLISGVISFTHNKRFLPFLPDDLVDDDKIAQRCQYTMNGQLSKGLKKFWRECNEAIQEHNDMHPDEDEVPFIDETLTWYAVRHSFAMHYVSMPDASPIALATLMGRSANGLAQYLETLQEDANLVSAADVLNY